MAFHYLTGNVKQNLSHIYGDILYTNQDQYLLFTFYRLISKNLTLL